MKKLHTQMKQVYPNEKRYTQMKHVYPNQKATHLNETGIPK